MKELSVVNLCQIFSNFTETRCIFIEHSNTCRCGSDLMKPISPTNISTANEIMMSEVFLIFFVLALWLSAIGFCLNQYKSLRRLETQVHYCVSRKDPLNIGEIKIVAREQDSIIYQKKRYSTSLDSQIDPERLRTMHYVHHYLPKSGLKTIPSAVSILVNNHDNNYQTPVTFYQPNDISLSSNSPSIRRNESIDEQMTTEIFTSTPKLSHRKNTNVEQRKSTKSSMGLTVPHVTNVLMHSLSRNTLNVYGNSRSAQHLCVPFSTLKANRYSAGNISLPVPRETPKRDNDREEHLLDPRLIPESVRRSLLALHRESQENVNMQKNREKTQSENDVHGAFYPWKIKMKSTMKRKARVNHVTRPHSNTVNILTTRDNSYDRDHRLNDYRQSSLSSRTGSGMVTTVSRRGLKYYQKYSTQSTSESESAQTEQTNMTNVYVSHKFNENDDQTKLVAESDERPLLTTS